MPGPSAPKEEAGLIRAIGIPGLAANVVNSTIGAGIFALPAAVALQLGAASPLAYIICALAMCLFVTSFAMAGSRVSLTGGLYAYVEVAFGPYIGFLAGVLYFLTAILAISGIVQLIATSVGGLIPLLATQIGRVLVILFVLLFLAAINIRGVRIGASAVEAVTLIKLAPLVIFIIAGIFFLRPDATAFPALAAVSVWATGQRYEPSAVSTCLTITSSPRLMQWGTPSSRTRFPRRRLAGSRYPTPASASASSA